MRDPAGRLDLRETFTFLRGALGRRLPRRRGPLVEASALAEVELPSTALARWAIDTCEAASPPWLSAHAMRTWLWGSALARREGSHFDEELAFTACLLHDLALTATHQPAAGCCFAVHGAVESRRLLAEQGLQGARAERVAEAISRHLDLSVPLALGEARVVREGAAFDVIGARFRELPDAREKVLQRHPRLGFKVEVTRALRQQVRNAPRTRIAWLFRLGFPQLIAAAPFSEDAP